MSPLGRYASRYNTSEFDVDARNSCQAGNIGPNSDLVDIACADFGSVRIHCWPSTESSFHGGRRRWGRRRESNAAIVPFRLQAGQSMRCKVKLVELDLQFAANQPDVGCIGLRSAPSSTTVPTGDGKEVCLIELPAPDSVSGPGQSVALATPWLFNSEPITSNDGFARTARWTWTANDHNPCILHGAAVVQHPNQPFLVTCKVRGEASIPLANEKVKLKLKLRFDSDELGPRLWYFHPQEPESDLLSFEQAIAGLNAEIKEMNLKDCLPVSRAAYEQTLASGGGSASSPSNAARFHGTSVLTQPANLFGSRSYGDSAFSGHSTVLMGDATHNYHFTMSGTA